MKKKSRPIGRGFFVCLFSVMVLGKLGGYDRARSDGIEENSGSGAIMGKVAQIFKKWLNYWDSGAINQKVA
ncbi:hypothetical protein AAEO50_09755 [Rossellomorea oryzaecorticis]|uniref:Uncharacterized protein n=1 Tax=Rossellomorea oryzaecorticis TaxID=1396505 RepID=A0ABU9K907_9BACI